VREQWCTRLAACIGGAASGRKEPFPEESIDLVIQLGNAETVWSGCRCMELFRVAAVKMHSGKA